MCGIVGCLDLRGGGRVEPAVVEAMNRRLVHRGPDSDGLHADADLALAVRRLKIVDLEHGDQPFYSEDDAVVMVCNGEIFNFRQLRAGLIERGHRFRSHTDVEVLVHLYEECGSALLDQLNGQFAVAIWDRQRRRLLLARDPFGVNPLFYTEVDGLLIFGSEIKALLEHPLVERRVDLTGLDQVLSLPGLVSPRTLFAGISSLPPGHCLEVEDGRISVRQYWDLDFPPQGDEPAIGEAAEERLLDDLRQALTGSVERRLMADVPIGLFLSGGLDSSLIGALVGEVAPGAVRHSFSVSFDDPEIDEGRYQRLAARQLGTEHREIRFGLDDMAKRLRDMVYFCECPVKETFNTCAMALSEAARQTGVPVVLAGQGADELFGGYIGYRFDQLGRGAGAPPGVEEILEEELRQELWGDPDLFYEKNQVAFRETKQALYSAAVNERFAEFDCLRFPLVDRRRLAGRHPLHQRSYLDLKLRLADHLLSDHGDRMVMANSVEGRYPFLDPEVIEIVRRMPVDMKVRDGEEKYAVRRVAEGLVPAAVLRREKFGFRAPPTPALLELPWVDELLRPDYVAERGYFDPAAVERLRQRYSRPDFRLHPHLETDLLMVVLSFHLLLQLFELPDLSP